MNKDMCVVCDDGILNIRVGAIIMKDGKILMVGNDRDYLYSVGGSKEWLVWVSLDEDIKMYPEFFKTELKNPTDTVKHFTTDKR